MEGAQEVISGDIEAINPPVSFELGDGVRPYWDKLVKAKAGRVWNDQDLLSRKTSADHTRFTWFDRCARS